MSRRLSLAARAAFALAFAAFGLALTRPAEAALNHAQALGPDGLSCAAPIGWAERLVNSPERLLASVALAESGRWDPVHRAKVAWPWTVTAEGQGRFFPTKAAAIAWVKTLRARGIKNIDVGCMQVNLMHHPDAFATLDEAFEPATNDAWAAAFLARLYHDKRSWTTAVGLYHSATPVYHFAYRRKVLAIWNEERRLAAEEKRREVLAAYRTRQALQLAEAHARDAARHPTAD
jgi:hypothetical protein